MARHGSKDQERATLLLIKGPVGRKEITEGGRKILANFVRAKELDSLVELSINHIGELGIELKNLARD